LQVTVPDSPLLVVEDDRFLRMLQVVLDPDTPAERYAAFADFFAHEAGLDDYCARVRATVPGLFPARVQMVDTQDELRAALPEARGAAVEALTIGREELATAPKLKFVQKYGLAPAPIDTAACAERGVSVLTIRRRANIACAEHALALMLTQARKLDRFIGRVTVSRLAEIGHHYKPFERQHTPNSNWGRVGGIRLLHGATLGLIGLGEIGREIADRAVAFGMRVLYFQRRRLPEAEENARAVAYAPLDTLLAEADWLIPQLPEGPATRNLIGAPQLARMKPDAFIVNVSRPDVIERAALIDALKSGRLGGFALDPLYQAPARDDDELLQLNNVIMVPHLAGAPRLNALADFEEIVAGMARALAR
jgi:phosphoglycerate dehydrogenase-like enzyme